jgi:hypothetical protein
MAKLPDFIVIGVGKAGTTSLLDYLKQHPQIYLCPKKETFYFTSIENRSNHIKYGAVQTFDEYQELFQNAPEGNVVGEISTTYYAHCESAKLIYSTLPEVKIIAILRNPIERAFSAYQMHVNNGSETSAFSEVITPEAKYVKNGFYHSQLLTYYEMFPEEQISILFYDDYCKDINNFLKRVFTFVGVDGDFIVDTSKRGRVGGVPKRAWVRRLLNEKNLARSVAATVLKTVLPLDTRQKMRQYLLKQNTMRISLDQENYMRLAEIYREDILKLQQMVKRDLSHWLSPRAES